MYHFLQYIYTFQRDTQCCSTDCLLMHRCQLYMFQTVMVHPQELLFRCCMCRLWHVVRTTDTYASINNQCCNIVYLVGMYIYSEYISLLSIIFLCTCDFREPHTPVAVVRALLLSTGRSAWLRLAGELLWRSDVTGCWCRQTVGFLVGPAASLSTWLVGQTGALGARPGSS